MLRSRGTGRAALLPVSFFEQPTEIVARRLIGRTIVSRTGGAITVARIVETEAYLGHRDPASHGYANRRHARNESLYGRPGTWYVYRSYGVHWCANLVCGIAENDGAVLLRAAEPIEGLEAMRRRRGGGVKDRLLASGPGRLTQALGIDLTLDGARMRLSEVGIGATDPEAPRIVASRRIGITKAVEWPLRFTLAGSKWVSR